MPEQAPLGAKCLDKSHMSSEAKARRDKDGPGSRLHHEIAPGAHAQVVEQGPDLASGKRESRTVGRAALEPAEHREGQWYREPCRGLRRRCDRGWGVRRLAARSSRCPGRVEGARNDSTPGNPDAR
jgi:hypothetical protein